MLAGDQPGRGRGGLLRLALVVESDHLDLAALDPARPVHLLDRELDAAIARGSERRFGAGHRADFADLDHAGVSGTYVSAPLRLLLAGGGESEHADQEFRGHAAHGRAPSRGKKASLLNIPFRGDQPCP